MSCVGADLSFAIAVIAHNASTPTTNADLTFTLFSPEVCSLRVKPMRKSVRFVG